MGDKIYLKMEFNPSSQSGPEEYPYHWKYNTGSSNADYYELKDTKEKSTTKF